LIEADTAIAFLTRTSLHESQRRKILDGATLMISRRTAAQGAVALAYSVSTSSKTKAQTSRPHTFVLVHGAWHGGWCWRMVSEYLRSRGHKVFAPTMTGLGEKSHLASADVNLDTHMTDVSNLLIWEELENVILVGHSYGGGIISGVCDAHKDRISHAIFLDAVAPNSGDTMIGGATVEEAEKRLGPFIDGYLAPPREPVSFGIPESMSEELAWVRRRVTPHLVGTWTQEFSFNNGGSDGLPRTFIYCSDKPPLSEQQKARLQSFKDDPTWHYDELPCGHDSMVILPIDTAQMLERIADET
jgi:pimeloyl-ACP methyl ester carboxylesterase